ncbi:MAG: exodeoxyribonuclease VII large subunit [Pyrinomonadaceae bacterium]
MRHPLLMSLFDEGERRPLSVSELTSAVRSTLEGRFASVWVEGEISNFKAHAASGHWYFTIKDEGAQLRAACFRTANKRIRFRPSDGLQVRARGRLTVYEPRGEYQLDVEAIDPVGAGALRVAFEQLRDKLASEGLFAEELKRELPVLPRRVGVVTSPSGAAIRDILTVIARRTRTVHVLFAPARVQGETAASEIARAIELLNEHHARAIADGRTKDKVDVIIVGRGGGSIEDLWAFNEERVARAIRASIIPVISAVGHETDFTIADFAADLRAATPSAAAELVAEREDEIEGYIESCTRDLFQLMRYRIADERTRVHEAAMSHGFDEVQRKLRAAKAATNEAAHKIETLIRRRMETARRRNDAVNCRLSPAELSARVARGDTRLAVLSARRNAAANDVLDDKRGRLAVAAASLDALSPLAVLTRGYALAQNEAGRALRDARDVEIGDAVSLRLAHGVLHCRVEDAENV